MGAPVALNYESSYNQDMKQAHSLKVKQATHNRSSTGSIPVGPTIKSLRKQGKWPFPEWENGHIVMVKVVNKRQPKPNWFKEVGEALY